MSKKPHKLSSESLMDFLPLPGLLVNSKRQLIAANQEGQTLLRSLKIGQDLTFSTQNADVLKTLEELQGGKVLIEKDSVQIGPDGRYFQLTGRNIRQGDDGKGLFLLVFTDVTQSRISEKIRSAFIANVSHELRSPLSTLIGAVETLKTTAKGDPVGTERFLGMMEEEAWRMKRLVDDLLSLSKLEARENIPPEGKINLGKIISTVMDAMETRAKPKKMKLVCECSAKLPEITGDFDEIQEVIDNLLDNAIKYGSRGSQVTLNVKVMDFAPDIEGPAVCICINNRGEVIPKKQIPRLTERFYRVDKSRSRGLGGTGLGLAIVKHIIKHHQGTLEIESSAKKGTTVKVIFPQ